MDLLTKLKDKSFTSVESSVCEYESSAHVLAVSCGLIMGRVESLRGLRWMGVLFKWMLSFHKLSLFGKSRTAIHRHVKACIWHKHRVLDESTEEL